MLMAARDRYEDDTDVANRLNQEGKEEVQRKIDALFGELVFQNGGRIEDEGLDDEDIYVDLGDDSIKDIETELEDHVSEAVKNGLSNKKENKLNEIIKKYVSVRNTPGKMWTSKI